MMIELLITIILVALVLSFISYKIGKGNGLKQQIELNQLSNDKILQERTVLNKEIEKAQLRIQEIESEYQSKKQLIIDAKSAAEHEYNERLDNLNNQYAFKEQELKANFTEKSKQLEASYEEERQNLMLILDEVKNKLDAMQRQQAAVIEQKQKEAMLKEQADLYKLNVSDTDLTDIKLLRSIQFKLTNKRILSMLIWQTFYQPLAKKKFPIILGKKENVCGIYKITNMLDDKIYIGQSVDIYKRFCQHCRMGLGIDTPQNNKLYAAMIKDGLENFTFELLEECPSEELNNKEAYYISLYNSVQYGYNSVKGNING